MVRLRALGLMIISLSLVGLARAEEMPVTPGDRLTVSVAGEPDLSKSYVVDQAGEITVTYLGKVPVKGLSPAQVRDELAKLLKKFLRDPQVGVEFMERAQITVGITGMVNKPGSITLKKGSRLTDLLAVAQGFTMDADLQAATLQRVGEPSAKRLDLEKIRQDATLNIELRNGDAVVVPAVFLHRVRVVGAVQKPDEIKRPVPVGLIDAISSVGGQTADADGDSMVQILRKGATEPELVSLGAVKTGKVKQPVLADGDVVTVLETPRIEVKVFGHVAKAASLKVKEGATVLDAVIAAGGFDKEADKAGVYVTIPANGGAETETVKRLNLEKIEGPDAGMRLQEGWRVFVPQAVPIRFAVAGGVNTPGVFPMPIDKSTVRLSDALAQAGGMVPNAKKKNVVLVRKDPTTGEAETRSIDWSKYLDPKKRDESLNVEIKANDVVYVDVEPDIQKESKLRGILGIAGAFFGL